MTDEELILLIENNDLVKVVRNLSKSSTKPSKEVSEAFKEKLKLHTDILKTSSSYITGEIIDLFPESIDLLDISRIQRTIVVASRTNYFYEVLKRLFKYMSSKPGLNYFSVIESSLFAFCESGFVAFLLLELAENELCGDVSTVNQFTVRFINVY